VFAGCRKTVYSPTSKQFIRHISKLKQLNIRVLLSEQKWLSNCHGKANVLGSTARDPPAAGRTLSKPPCREGKAEAEEVAALS